jgi:hypothetical protein
MKPRAYFTVPALLTLALVAHPASGSPDAEGAAIEVANQWLGLVDSSRFAESWQQAASLFRETVSEAQWETAVSAARRPLGTLISRSVRGSQYTESLPGAPDGRYVVIQYDAVFPHKKAAIETVTPMYEDGVWKVAGYYIK